MKKLLITLGTAASIATPLVTAISCSEEAKSYNIDYVTKSVTYKVEGFNLKTLTDARWELINKANNDIKKEENKLTPEEVKIYAQLWHGAAKLKKMSSSTRTSIESYFSGFHVFLKLGNVRIDVIHPYSYSNVETTNIAATELQKHVIEEYKEKLKPVLEEIAKLKKEMADDMAKVKVVTPKLGQHQQVKIGI